MAQYQVTTAELKNAITDLQDKNRTFKTKVSELEQEQQTLKGQWKGDANNAFNSAFETDKGKWDTFSGLIEQYISALQNIMDIYDKAEAENVTTATNRTYN